MREASCPILKEMDGASWPGIKSELQRLKVTVNIERKASLELVMKEKPDVVIVATGSKYRIPAVPGTDKKNVVTATELLLGKKKFWESVVVIWG